LESLKAAENAGNQVYIANILQNLGVLYQSQGAFGKALEFLEKGRNIWVKHFDENHPDCISIEINIGMALRDLGRFNQARAIHQNALAKCETHLGHEHPSTLETKIQLCDDLLKLSQPYKALNLLLESKDACQDLFGDHHSRAREIKSRILTICRDLGMDDLEQEITRDLQKHDMEHPLAPREGSQPDFP